MTAISRRRAIFITAAAALLPPGTAATAPAGAHSETWRWRGAALGTEASIKIIGIDARRAETLIETCVDEIRRLENEFSLFRPDSAISRLNAAGRLETPSGDMLRLLNRALHTASISGGAFDPTVQTLWQLYADYFSAVDANVDAPPHTVIAQALEKVDWRRVSASAAAIRLGAGQKLSLNGIAQGFITDRVADLLRAAGLNHVLINLGEFRALGPRAASKPWRIALNDGTTDPAQWETMPLADWALATSGGYGLQFDRHGRFHHLIDARSGLSPSHYRSVSVVAKTATIADALSTALTMLPPDAISGLLQRGNGETAHVVFDDGRRAVYHPDRQSG